jgi:hypothetical protein
LPKINKYKKVVLDGAVYTFYKINCYL